MPDVETNVVPLLVRILFIVGKKLLVINGFYNLCTKGFSFLVISSLSNVLQREKIPLEKGVEQPSKFLRRGLPCSFFLK